MLIKVVEDHIILRLFLLVSSQPPREVLWLVVVFLHTGLGQVEHSIQQEGLCGLQAQHKLCGPHKRTVTDGALRLHCTSVTLVKCEIKGSDSQLPAGTGYNVG